MERLTGSFAMRPMPSRSLLGYSSKPRLDSIGAAYNPNYDYSKRAVFGAAVFSYSPLTLRQLFSSCVPEDRPTFESRNATLMMRQE